MATDGLIEDKPIITSLRRGKLMTIIFAGDADGVLGFHDHRQEPIERGLTVTIIFVWRGQLLASNLKALELATATNGTPVFYDVASWKMAPTRTDGRWCHQFPEAWWSPRQPVDHIRDQPIRGSRTTRVGRATGITPASSALRFLASPLIPKGPRDPLTPSP